MPLDMFINMGPNIVGESADKAQGAKGDIDVVGWSWGMSQSGTTNMASGGGGGGVKANFQDLSFTKYVDAASSALMMSLAKGTRIKTVTLLARKTDAAQATYITMELSNVIVTSVSTGGNSGQDRLTENVTLNFSQVKYTYNQQAKSGAKAGDKVFAWDIAGNAAAG